MKTLLLLILPLSISLSAFGQIKRSNPRGGSVKNAPVTTHRPAVKIPKPTSNSSSVSPVRTRPSFNSSSNSSSSSSSSSFSNSSRGNGSSESTYYHNTNYNMNNNETNSSSYYGNAPRRLVDFHNICSSTGGNVVSTRPYDLVRTLTDHIEKYAGDSTDIVILIDISGSMGNNVKSIASESDAIIVSVPQGSRVGAASFRLSNSSTWFKHSDLSEDHWNAMDFIGQKRKYMSSESHLDAIVNTVSASTWKNKERMIITITDELISPSENIKSQSQAIHAANQKDVSLHTIFLEN